jgi:hypothetical protein
MNGAFAAWYETVHESLMDDPVRGQLALANSDPRYALLRDGMGLPHPLFASSGGGFYESNA